MPLTWDELRTADPADFTVLTVPEIVQDRGDAWAWIDDMVGDVAPPEHKYRPEPLSACHRDLFSELHSIDAKNSVPTSQNPGISTRHRSIFLLTIAPRRSLRLRTRWTSASGGRHDDWSETRIFLNVSHRRPAGVSDRSSTSLSQHIDTIC